jgi:hypothetical protein
MGCGNIKQGDNKGVSLPAKGFVSSRLTMKKQLPDPRDKLSPEVLQGFTRLVKSFYIAPQPQLHKSTRSNITSGTEKQPRDDLVFDENLAMDLPMPSSPPPDQQPSQGLLSLSIPTSKPIKRSPSEAPYEPSSSPLPLNSSSAGTIPLPCKPLIDLSAEAEDRAAKLREQGDREMMEKMGAVQGMRLEADGIMAKYR